MKTLVSLKKNIIIFGTVLAVFASAGPAGARWDELITPGTYYAGPVVHKERESQSVQALYTVRYGDTLSGIAGKFGFSAARLAQLNNLSDSDQIYAGQVLHLPRDIVLHRVKKGETLSEISLKYKVNIDYLAACNSINNTDMVPEGKELAIPVGSGPITEAVSRDFSAGQLPWPVIGWISSPFGMRNGRIHEGIDIAANTGEPITAVSGGRVVFAGAQDGYGLTVIIDHGNGLSTLYAHCSRLLVKAGDRVASGQLIARVGSTGRSTGPHLHLEVRLNGVPRDPMIYLQRAYA